MSFFQIDQLVLADENLDVLGGVRSHRDELRVRASIREARQGEGGVRNVLHRLHVHLVRRRAEGRPQVVRNADVKEDIDDVLSLALGDLPDREALVLLQRRVLDNLDREFPNAAAGDEALVFGSSAGHRALACVVLRLEDRSALWVVQLRDLLFDRLAATKSLTPGRDVVEEAPFVELELESNSRRDGLREHAVAALIRLGDPLLRLFVARESDTVLIGLRSEGVVDDRTAAAD